MPVNEEHSDLWEEIKQVEKAYGGCHDCYGKGYATVNDRWHGNDTDTDIGSPGGYVSGGNPNAMKFCKCDRGKQLEQLIERAVMEARLDERLKVDFEVERECRDTEKAKAFVTPEGLDGYKCLARDIHLDNGDRRKELEAQLTKTNAPGKEQTK